MFGLITRSHHDEVVVELRRQLDILAEQIDWLRAHLGTPTARPALNPSEQPPVMSTESPWMSDEEEELRFLRESGQITDQQLDTALEELLAQRTVLEFQPTT